jgi:S2P endopeptidase
MRSPLLCKFCLLPPVPFVVPECTFVLISYSNPTRSEQIPLSTVGLSLTFILPSAFVTFPNATLTPPSSSPIQSSKAKLKQRAMARMRLVAGGAWHNLVFWGVLVLFGSSSVAGLGKGWIWGLVGYEDVSLLGRVVVGLDEVILRGPLYNVVLRD